MEKYFKNIYLKSSSLPIRYQSPSLSVIPFTCTRLLSTTQLIPNKLLNYKNIQNHNIHSSIYSSISIPTQSLDINNSLSINTDFNRQYHCTINNVYSKNKLTTEQLYDLSNSIALATGIKLSASSKLVLKSILPKIQKLYYSTNNPQDFNNVNENHNILNNVNFEKDLNTIKSNYNDNNKEKLNITSEENNLNKNNSNINMNIPKSKVKESKGVEYIRKLYKLNPAHYSYNKGQANNYNNTNTNQVYNNAFSYNKNKPIEVIIHETTSWRLFMKKCIVSVTAVLFTIICILSFLEKQNNNGGVPFHDVEYSTSKSDVNFDDVQGVDEAKEELREVVEFLKNPEKFTRIGGKLPKGILLYGPPGTGKTYLAKAVAGESGVPFFQMSGSEFDELYVGVGAKRVRQLVALARKKAPCIVFIDELDAVGSKRNSKDQGYMKQTLNQLLVELDGFNSSEGVIFIAATNQLEALDKALIRPGRFDRHIPVPLPDMSGREKIIETHIKNIHIGRDVDINMLARGTTGFSGADLANLINQAAIKASKDNKLVVHMDDLEWAKDKIIMGIERKTAYVDEESKKATSFHETGHAIVALHTPGALPLHKVTIIQRGDALGVTIQIPTKDKTSYTKKELLAMIDVCMGGRVAEELTYGPDEVSTGASNDLEKATSIAREMVMTYGMADRIGLVSYKNVEWASLNSTTQLAIEAEIKTILENSRQRVLQLIKSHKTEYNNIANTLFIKETLSNEEIKEIASGIDIIKKEKEEAETKRKLQDRKNSMKSKENIDEINKVSNEDGVINNNKKYNNKDEFLLVTSTNDKKSSRINVNTKTDGNNTLSSFKSPISVISNENVLNFINELKPNSFINGIIEEKSSNIKEKNEEIPKSNLKENNEEIPEADLKENAEKTHEPLKTDDITDVPRTLSTFSSLSFISSDIFKSTSFQLSHQGSLDIVNYIINENDFKKAQEKEEKERKEKEEKEREEREKEQQIKEEKEKDLRPQIKTNIEKVSSPIKSAIEGFKTEITGSPLSAVNQSLTINSINARNDLQSNMNGTVFQNNRFNTYLETLNTFNQSELINPYSQPLLVSYKSNIKDQRTQLQHMSDVKRYTFDQIIKNYDEKNKKIQDMTPMKEEDLISWLKDATPEDIYENMHKIIGIPKKMNLMSKKTTEVVSSSSNYPILSIDNYLYQEPKAFTPLYARFKDHNVSLYIKDSDLCCTDRYNSSKLSIFPFPLHIVIGVSSCDNILNIHVVIQNPTKDYCIKTLSFITATDAIALTYSNILYQNVYFDEDSVLRTTFVQIYIDDDNEDLKTFVNRWFRVPFELANCHYEIITDINQISIVSQVFIFMSQKKELYKSVEKLNKWEDSMAIVHQTIYGHPLQVIMAALKERLYERWMLEYNDWKRYQ